MANISKYLKIAKDAEIEPEDSIDRKIMDRISNIREDEKDEILDRDFQQFLKNNNSKLYHFEQKVRSHPGLFAGVSILVMAILAILAFMTKLIISEESR